MRRAILTLFAGLVIGAAPLMAQGVQFASKGMHTADTARIDALDRVATARQLATLGINSNLPLALVAAAQILMDQPVTKSSVQPQRHARDHAGEAHTRQDTPDAELDPAKLLALAAAMPSDNPHVHMLIEGMQSQLSGGARGATGGPVTYYGRVEVGYYNWYAITFNGSESAQVIVDGDGTSDLDCYAYAQDGTLIDSDTDYTDYCILSWWENWTGTVRIEIHNVGSYYNDYVLMTN